MVVAVVVVGRLVVLVLLPGSVVPGVGVKVVVGAAVVVALLFILLIRSICAAILFLQFSSFVQSMAGGTAW